MTRNAMDQPTALPHSDAASRPSSSTASAGEGSRLMGVVPPVIVPCRAPGEVDPPAMGRLCRRLVEHGCHGLFLISSTGEMPFLGAEDRRRLIAAAREAAPAGTVLYAGVSGLGIEQTLGYARDAAAEGADVAVVMVPFFLKLAQDELLAYFRTLADRSPIPVEIYHHLRMPTKIGVETAAALAEHPNIVAMKDTTGDADRLIELVRATRHGGVAVFQGNEPLILAGLENGAAGCVSALANIAPAWHRELFDAHHAGDRPAAQAAQAKIDRLFGLFQLPQIDRSFAHFAYTLRRAAVELGWIDTMHGMVPGFTPDAAFERAVADQLRTAGLL